MNIPDFKEFGHKGINWEQRCRYKYPEFFNYINNTYPNDLKFSEKIYWYLHKINEHPTCKICGNPVKYVDGHIGYKTYCSNKCVAKDPEIIQKREQTNLHKFGVKNAFQSEEIKEKIKHTNIQKYGTKYAMQNEAIKEKFYNSMIQKYGVKHALQESTIYEKAKQTLLKNYGIEYCSKNAKLLEKIYRTNMKKYGTKLPLQNSQIIQKVNQKFIEKDENVIGIEDDFFICKCPHSNCNKCQEKVFKIKRSLYSNRKYLKTELCTKLVKEKQISGTTIELFIQNLLDNYNIIYEKNNRKILKRKELDIFIPTYNIAIECNGIYWHSLKSPSYHLNKWKDCQQQGIHLLTFWEDQIKNSPTKVENILKCILNINKPVKITENKYTVKDISSKQLESFLNENHIRGYIKSKIRLGIFEKDQLVSVLCAGFKKSKTKEIVIYRFCNIIEKNYSNSFEILFKYLLKKASLFNYPLSITLSNDIDYISSEKLNKLGFQLTDIKSHKFYIHSDKTKRVKKTQPNNLQVYDSGISKFYYTA